MQASIRIRKLLSLAVATMCGAGLAASTEMAEAQDPCPDGCPGYFHSCSGMGCTGGADFCGAIQPVDPNDPPLICYISWP